jgi:hypothetical protein
VRASSTSTRPLHAILRDIERAPRKHLRWEVIVECLAADCGLPTYDETLRDYALAIIQPHTRILSDARRGAAVETSDRDGVWASKAHAAARRVAGRISALDNLTVATAWPDDVYAVFSRLTDLGAELDGALAGGEP